ncbi:MAG: carbonic anhydrase [Candidatus Eremiobacteraeota bacterium]|nr:carbonic anhydrase [Candidatus Eremiobacteraeota bacterium]
MSEFSQSPRLNRRDFAVAACAAATAIAWPRIAFSSPASAMPTADEALKRLLAGNARFVTGKTMHPDQAPGYRNGLAKAQHPFAIVLSCSDSRVPPEIAFDQGLGDVFTIRIAGAVYDDPGLGSMEYAVEHFHSPLLVVMGHENCGAVIATIDAVDKPGGEAPGHIGSLVSRIKPAAESTKGKTGNRVDNAVRQCIKNTVDALKTEKIMADAIAAGKLRIVGARYSLTAGSVSVIA